MEEKEIEKENNMNTNNNQEEEKKLETNENEIIYSNRNNNNDDFFAKIKLIKDKHKEHNDESKNIHFSLSNYKMDKVLGDEKLKSLFEMLEPNKNNYPSVNFQIQKKNINDIESLFPKTNFNNIQPSNNKTINQLNSLYKDIDLLNERNKPSSNQIKKFEEIQRNINENLNKKINKGLYKKEKEKENDYNNTNTNMLKTAKFYETNNTSNTLRESYKIGSFLNITPPSLNPNPNNIKRENNNYNNLFDTSKFSSTIDLKYNKNYFISELSRLNSNLDKACDLPIKSRNNNNKRNIYKRNIGLVSQYYNKTNKFKKW